MKKENCLIIIIMALIFSSCSTILNEKIEPSTLEDNVRIIKEKYPDLDSLKVDILDKLIYFNKGRDAYISELESIMEDSEFSLKSFIVDEEKFNEQKDNLFNYFEAQEISFGELLAEIDTIHAINDRFDNEAQDLYQKIDAYCSEKQKEIEASEKKAEEIKARLNEMVDLKIISIRETEYDYSDVIEVKIQMTNKTSKPIEAISFNMELTDKLGNKLATLGCKSNDRFVNSDVGYWIYDRWDNSEIYNSLKNTRLSHITTKSEISKINHGGELISAYDDLLIINFEYETPEKLDGYCPYLDDTDELKIELDKLKKRKEIEIQESTPIMNKYKDITLKLINIPNIFD